MGHINGLWNLVQLPADRMADRLGSRLDSGPLPPPGNRD